MEPPQVGPDAHTLGDPVAADATVTPAHVGNSHRQHGGESDGEMDVVLGHWLYWTGDNLG